MALWRRGCPRCVGDVFEETGLLEDRSLTCLQCGRTLNAAQEAQLRSKTTHRVPAAAQRTAAA